MSNIGREGEGGSVAHVVLVHFTNLWMSSRSRLEFGDVVLLTSLGYSPSGGVFYVQSESLAAECASSLAAAKIVFFTRVEAVVDRRTGRAVQNLRLCQAVSLLNQHHLKQQRRNHQRRALNNTVSSISPNSSNLYTNNSDSLVISINDARDYDEYDSESSTSLESDYYRIIYRFYFYIVQFLQLILVTSFTLLP